MLTSREVRSDGDGHQGTVPHDNTRLKAEAPAVPANGQPMNANDGEDLILSLRNEVATSRKLANGLQLQVNTLTNSNEVLKATVIGFGTELEDRMGLLMRELRTSQSQVAHLETQLRLSAENKAAIIAQCESQIRDLTNAASAEKNAATAVLEAQIVSLSAELAHARERIRQQDLLKTSRESGVPSNSPRSPGYRIRASPSSPRSREPTSWRRSPDRRASPEELQLLVRAIMMSRGVQI